MCLCNYSSFYSERTVILSQVWSVTTGALLDSLCGADAPVTCVLLFNDFVVSASTATSSILLWNLKYDASTKPAIRIPADSAHIALTKDGDQVFYVHQQSHTEVMSWNSHTGQR